MKHWKRHFFTMWSGQAVSVVGSSFVGFAIRWWIADTTGSAAILSIMTTLHLLPVIFLGPFVGALVDRWNRKRVMIAADSFIAILTAGMALLYRAGLAAAVHVYVFTILTSTAALFHRSAIVASTSLMVPKKHLTRVAGMNQTVASLMNIVSQPVGALLVMILPMASIFALDMVTAVVAIAPLIVVRIPQPRQAREPLSLRRYGKELAEGFRFVREWREFSLLLLLIVLFRLGITPGFHLLPILVIKHYRGGADLLGWIMGSAMVGMVTGGLLLSSWGGFKRRTLTVLMSMGALGLAIIGMGFVPPTARAAGIAIAFVVGTANALYHGPVTAIIQTHVPAAMQARVLTLRDSAIHIATPLGLLAGGALADRTDITVVYVIGGALAVCATIVMCLSPRVLRLEDHAPQEGSS